MITGGSKALREKGNLNDESSYLIDFGESREGAIEGVDDFKVIHRLKELSITLEDEYKMKDQERLNEITAKSELLRTSKKWLEIYHNAEKLAETSPENALAYAWNSTALLSQNAVEDFFVVVKNLLDAGHIEKPIIDTFIEKKSEEKMSPFVKNLVAQCVRWLNSAQ